MSIKGNEDDGINHKRKAIDDEDTLVDLVVGGYKYSASRNLLLNSPHLEGKDCYFHALLSDLWNEASKPILEVKDRDGPLFLYVLYYLRLGDIPRAVGMAGHNTLLSKDDVNGLEEEAQFFCLPGLVKLCQLTKDVLKGVKGTGDLDLSPFSDFSVKIDKESTRYEYEFGMTMEYTFQDATKVEVGCQCNDYSGNVTQDIWMTIHSDPPFKLDNESFTDHFKCLQKLVESEFDDKKAEDKDKASVARVLQQTKIPPAAHLWFAFVIGDMISYFGSYKHWDGEYDDAVGFLFSDTSSCFVCGMESVK